VAFLLSPRGVDSQANRLRVRLARAISPKPSCPPRSYFLDEELAELASTNARLGRMFASSDLRRVRPSTTSGFGVQAFGIGGSIPTLSRCTLCGRGTASGFLVML
jgi:hypothetical protein